MVPTRSESQVAKGGRRYLGSLPSWEKLMKQASDVETRVSIGGSLPTANLRYLCLCTAS